MPNRQPCGFHNNTAPDTLLIKKTLLSTFWSSLTGLPSKYWQNGQSIWKQTNPSFKLYLFFVRKVLTVAVGTKLSSTSACFINGVDEEGDVAFDDTFRKLCHLTSVVGLFKLWPCTDALNLSQLLENWFDCPHDNIVFLHRKTFFWVELVVNIPGQNEDFAKWLVRELLQTVKAVFILMKGWTSSIGSY